VRGYLFSPDVVRVVFVVGVVVSVLFYERMQLTTGGAIVPAYLALSLGYPATLVSTLIAGYLTWLIVNKVIVRRRILYGRRKFEVELLVGLSLVVLSILGELLFNAFTRANAELSTIGFLVPGIIAHDMFRQGPKKTIVAILANVAVLGCLILIFATVLPLFGANPRPERTLATATGYDRRLILPAIGISVIVCMAVFAEMGVRCGGFIGGAYLAFLLPRWGDLLVTAAVAILTWYVVAELLIPRLLLFGRRKLSTMVLFGALIGWSFDIGIRLATDGRFEPGVGLPIMTLMVPALIANDAQRQGWGRTVLGVGLGMSAVAGIVSLLNVVLVLIGVIDLNRPPLSVIEAYGALIVVGAVGVGGAWSLKRRQAQSQAAMPAVDTGD